MGKVSYTLETLPPISKKERDRVAAIKDDDIDFSDIPEVKELSGLRPRLNNRLYKPIKIAVTCKLDADIVAWLKQGGKGYQTRLNSILRQIMVHALLSRALII